MAFGWTITKIIAGNFKSILSYAWGLWLTEIWKLIFYVKTYIQNSIHYDSFYIHKYKT